jgi:hypothetical protein
MDDVWVRASLLVGVLLVAGLVVLFLRRKPSRPERLVPITGLESGLYLFTSTDCPTCQSAREKLSQEMPGFEEIVWEQQPDRFSDLGVDVVPAVLVVQQDGSGRLFPGQPDRVLRDL